MLAQNPLLQSALAYARAGFRVFPCLAGYKEPACQWLDEATTEEEWIRERWQNMPEANLAIVTGDQWLVLDIDNKPGKPSGYETLRDILPQLPPTFTVTTPNHGEHRYFRKPPDWQPARRRGQGYDIQTDNAYVLAPPSVLGPTWLGRAYTVARGGAVAELPEVLRTFLDSGGGGPRVSEPDAGVPPALDRAELDACWPDVSEWPERIRLWWDHGDPSGYDSRSEAVNGLSWYLYQKSLTDEQVLAVMGEHYWTAQVALAHRRGDPAKAREWLWLSCLKTRGDRKPSAGEVFEAQAGESIEALYERLYARVLALNEPNTPGTLRELASVLAEGQQLSEVAKALLATLVGDRNLGMTRKQAEANLFPKKSRKGPKGSGSTVPELSSLKDHVWVGPLNRFYNLKTDAYIQHSALVHQYTHLANEKQTPAQVVEEFIANDRNVAEGLTYRPDQAPGRMMERGRLVWNTATPIALERMDGDIQPYLDLFDRMKIAGADRDRILDYFAWMLQKPGERIRHALAIGGKETGTGKDTLLEPMRQILTPRHHLEIRGEDLFSDFTGHLMGKRLVTVQETATPDLKEARNLERRISPLISQDLITIHPKGVDRYQAPNFLQIVVTTNEERPLHLSPEDRRFDMVRVALKYANESERHQWDEYWKWIHKWYTQWGGVNIVYTFLMDRDMSQYNPNKAPPRTVWHQEVVRGSRFEAEEIVYEAIDARAGIFRLPAFEASHALTTARGFFPGEMENGRRIGQKQVTNALSRLGYRKHEVVKGSRHLRDKRYLWARDEDWERLAAGRSGGQIIDWYDAEVESQIKDTVESNVHPLFPGAQN